MSQPAPPPAAPPMIAGLTPPPPPPELEPPEAEGLLFEEDGLLLLVKDCPELQRTTKKAIYLASCLIRESCGGISAPTARAGGTSSHRRS